MRCVPFKNIEQFVKRSFIFGTTITQLQDFDLVDENDEDLISSLPKISLSATLN
jgi:hypothetical protein